MNREEAKDCLKLIQANYENFRPADMTITLNLWAESFKDDPAEVVKDAIWAIIQTSTSDFAPKIGQVRQMMVNRTVPQIMNEAEAWNLVYNALCNSNYHANEEYNKLPEEIRRAVGGPDQLREWAMMDFDSITVAESNFKRTYRAIAEKRAEYLRMPQSMQPVIESAPLAKIEDKTEESTGPERASNEYVNKLLEKWRANDPVRETT